MPGNGCGVKMWVKTLHVAPVKSYFCFHLHFRSVDNRCFLLMLLLVDIPDGDLAIRSDGDCMEKSSKCGAPRGVQHCSGNDGNVGEDLD